MAEETLISNEELRIKIQKVIQDYYNDFSSQRSDYEDVWEVCDYAVKAGQNRTMGDSERGKGANLDGFDVDTELAQTGSTLFYTQYRQLAAQGISVEQSRPLPFSFRPVQNMDVFYSKEEADEQASQWNTLAKWNFKQDRMPHKSIEFWHQLRKYGNLAVMSDWNRRKGKRTIRKPIYEPFEGAEGNVENVVTGYKEETKDAVVENFFTLRVLPVDGIYADVQIGNLKDQDCIIVPSLRSQNQLWEGVDDKYYDEDQVREAVKKKNVWDQSTDNDHAKQVNDNLDLTDPIAATDLFLVRDVFIRAPIKDNGWNDEIGRTKIYWLTIVGNDINSGDIIRFERNRHPNDEMPFEMIHANPDDPNRLYHVSDFEIIRSNYSVECTLKNQAIDNATLVNRPPLIEVEGAVNGTDRQFKPDAHWVADSVDSIKEIQVRDTTGITIGLLDWVQNDTKQALGTTDSILGQAFGARTSALEASNAQRSAIQPHLINIRYVLDQVYTFYARNFQAYWRKFRLPGQIVAISDEEDFPEVYPENLYGEFDIEIDIVDEFENDLLSQQRASNMMQVIGNNQTFIDNTDVPELLTEWMKSNKMNYTKVISPPQDADARQVAHQENITMMVRSEPVAVRDGENSKLHLQEHEGERLRYKGVEDQFPQVSILDQHIAETKQAIAAGQAVGGAPAPAPSGNQGEGEAQGNEIAAQLGAALGG